ncbi:MAG: hypothetical protein BWX84_02777 [Verrucomicrobia bacterium ADurb.Bin118]|nr:MAG: hypothetical protein BWX84_02777 [Verrucomicrobia bacterium ADurb.Bin118]
MRGERAEERFAHRIAKEHVAGLRRPFGVEGGAVDQTADFLQGAGQALRVARELHRGGIRQKLALPAHGGLNQSSEEHAHPAQQHQHQTKQGQRIVPPPGAQKDAPDDRQAKNAENDAHEAQVQPHVPVQDVAELVSDDALQFIALEQLHAAARDADGGVTGRVPGGEGIDAVLLVHHVDLRHGHAGGEGHFLNHVAEPAFVGIGGVGRNEPAAKRFRHRPPAGG